MASHLPLTRKQKGNVDPTLILMLSLYLLLLAFFILLTTMSQFEQERTRKVLESVNVTFEGRVVATQSLPNPDAGTGALDGERSLTDQIESLFKQTIPAIEVDESADGTVLRIEMDARSLFRRGSTAFAPGRSALFRRLAEALTGPEGQARFFELAFEHAVPLGAGVGRDSLSVLRGGTVARHLGRLGVPAEKVSTAIWPVEARGGKAGKVALAVHLFPEAVEQGRVTPAQEGGEDGR